MKRTRKLADENRKFNVSWEYEYFHIMVHGNLTCLICKHSTKSIKGSNIRRHYIEQHKDFHDIKGELRTHKFNSMKIELSAQQNSFRKALSQPKNIVKASYSVAMLIGKKLKPFTDGEYIKEALCCIMDDIMPEKKSLMQTISLSRHTIANRIDDIAVELVNLLNKKISNFQSFALCLDESTDMSDSAQLAIFIRGTDENFEITEELLNLKTLHGITKGTDIFEAFWKSFTENKLSASLLCGVATDGAKAMVGQNKGFIGIFKKKMSELHIDTSDMYIFHCLIHQENLCSQSLQMNHVMDVVVKIVNFIRSRATNHRKFQQYLIELESEYGDVIYFSKVRWLSRGKCLRRFFELKEEIDLFLKTENIFYKELTDQEWLLDLCFLVDITEHLNELNLRLQGENILIVYSCQAIESFRSKLKLWENQLTNNEATHFHELNNFYIANKTVKKYGELIKNLSAEFDRRFQEISKYSKNFELFSSPFNVDVTTVHPDLQMEIIELQSKTELKTIFCEYDDKVSFYKKFIDGHNFPRFKKYCIRIVSAFGSSYLCESFFSKMKICKCKTRTSLLDQTLENQLRIATTKINIDITSIAAKKEKQISH